MDVTAKGVVGRVHDILANTLGIEPDERAAKFKDEMSLIDDLGCDSLDCMELILGVEHEFDIEVSDKDAEAVLTVRDLIQHVEKATA